MSAAEGPAPEESVHGGSAHEGPASLWRRLLAMVYDGFLLLSVTMLALFGLVVFANGGEAVSGPVVQVLLWFVCLSFYLYFWRTCGQTLGMQVWKVRAQNDDGSLLSPWQCLVRFAVATLSLGLCGLGFLWMLVDSERRTWQDMASASRIVYLGKDAYGRSRGDGGSGGVGSRVDG